MGITCGIDWAEIHHDIALADETGRIIDRARIDTGACGFNELLGLIAENGGTPEDTPIAIETDKNLLVDAYAIKNRSCGRPWFGIWTSAGRVWTTAPSPASSVGSWARSGPTSNTTTPQPALCIYQRRWPVHGNVAFVTGSRRRAAPARTAIMWPR
ncbi:hypothetical protein ACFTWF_02770 [Rhodococcus sp. NPDC056960]|uniref:hypothetical protein n=1 Tax=Rhodococcus sp. NPDC056960 TaxID=3345982 RepID=UPI00362D7898